MLDKHSKVIQAVFNSGECSMAFNLMILHGLARYQAVHIDLIKQWWCLKAFLNWYIGAYKFVLLTDLCIFASCIFFIEKKSNVRCYLLKILFKWFIHAFMYAFISLLLGIWAYTFEHFSSFKTKWISSKSTAYLCKKVVLVIKINKWLLCY